MVEFSKNAKSICRRLVGDKSGRLRDFIFGVETLTFPSLHEREIPYSPRTDRTRHSPYPRAQGNARR